MLLNKRNFSMYKTVEKLFRLGYTRMVHLRFLNQECIDLIMSKKLVKSLKRDVTH